ncbi:hypothetical protein Bbelb_406050 [Branchiostoma belcheri]|nr:hypothetical protein Bbelb_406050 [Branchiostoma belcheri]
MGRYKPYRDDEVDLPGEEPGSPRRSTPYGPVPTCPWPWEWAARPQRGPTHKPLRPQHIPQKMTRQDPDRPTYLTDKYDVSVCLESQGQTYLCAACGRPQAPASPPHRSSPHSHNQGVKCVQTTGKRRLPGRAGRNNPSQCGVHLRTSEETERAIIVHFDLVSGVCVDTLGTTPPRSPPFSSRLTDKPVVSVHNILSSTCLDLTPPGPSREAVLKQQDLQSAPWGRPLSPEPTQHVLDMAYSLWQGSGSRRVHEQSQTRPYITQQAAPLPNPSMAGLLPFYRDPAVRSRTLVLFYLTRVVHQGGFLPHRLCAVPLSVHKACNRGRRVTLVYIAAFKAAEKSAQLKNYKVYTRSLWRGERGQARAVRGITPGPTWMEVRRWTGDRDGTCRGVTSPTGTFQPCHKFVCDL